MPIDLSVGRSFFAKYEGRSIEDVADDVDHPRSSILRKVSARISPFDAQEESGEYYSRLSEISDAPPYRSSRSIASRFSVFANKAPFVFCPTIVDDILDI